MQKINPINGTEKNISKIWRNVAKEMDTFMHAMNKTNALFVICKRTVRQANPRTILEMRKLLCTFVVNRKWIKNGGNKENMFSQNISSFLFLSYG